MMGYKFNEHEKNGIPVRVEICTGAASAANETYGVSEFKAIL